jgi:anti-sigma regulatory factor (Ser/Thr protein kinase)
MTRQGSPALVVLDREYDGSITTLRAARGDVVDCLRKRSDDQDLEERAELVVSELTTNAVQACPGAAYRVSVSLADDGVVAITVTSCTANGFPPPRDAWGPAHATAPRGRGLLIVTELTDHVEVERPAEHTIVVTATLHADCSL